MYKKIAKLATACAMFLAVPAANATFMLSISDGNQTVVAVDEGVNDQAMGIAGYVTYTTANFGGGITPWTITTATGLTNPVIGSSSNRALHLDSLEVSSGGAGTLSIMLTKTDFYSGAADFWGILGGATHGVVDLDLYASANNTAFGLDTLLFDGGAMTQDFSDGFVGNLNLNGPYSVTMVATIHHDGIGQRTSFDFDVAVPAPASLALAGLGLLIAGASARRR